MTERVLLVGGPGDGLLVDVAPDATSISVHVMTDQRSKWVEVSDAPRGGVSGLVVGVGSYTRTEWKQDRLAVFRFRPLR